MTLLFLSHALAVEGMWLPEALPADAMRAAGWAPERLADPQGDVLGAVVHVGEGCSGAFVGADGLVLTNHHCVWDLLQHNTTPEHPMVDEGFAAASPADERWGGPTARLYVAESITDVTATVLAAAERAHSDEERSRAIDRAAAKLVDRCERGSGTEERRCEVSAEYGGAAYRLVAQRVIRDVRLVHVPPMTVGEFGGDRDNFEWPRHDADFAVLRAYVAPDGHAAPYDPANVPYRPPHHLDVEPRGIEPGAAVAIAGYPYETQRYELVAQLHHRASVEYPALVTFCEAAEAVLADEAERDPAAAAALGEDRAELANTRKYLQGVIDNVASSDVLPRKAAAEDALRAWIAADPARQREYGDVFPALDALQAEKAKTRERDAVLGQLLGGSPLLQAAHTAYRLSLERAKANDLDRESGYQQRDWSRIREAQERAQRSLDPRLDKALIGYWMRYAAALPAAERISGLDKIAGTTPGMAKADSDRAIGAYLDRLIAGTKLTDKDVRLALLDKTSAEIAATHDSFVDLALILEPLYEANLQAEKRRFGAGSRVRPRYAKALLAEAGGLVAPDANLTLRVTYGQVRSRPNAQDGIDYRAFTTLAGIEAKHTGAGEFDAPDAELAAIKALRAGKTSRFVVPELGDVPVDFLSTVDITGGNSGSPTLNAKGEFVGLVFDGTYDTVASDYVYDPVRTRSIHADVRYMLWTMTEADGASRLVEEMGVR